VKKYDNVQELLGGKRDYYLEDKPDTEDLTPEEEAAKEEEVMEVKTAVNGENRGKARKSKSKGDVDGSDAHVVTGGMAKNNGKPSKCKKGRFDSDSDDSESDGAAPKKESKRRTVGKEQARKKQDENEKETAQSRLLKARPRAAI
jgi:hypothetical protein